MAKPTIRRLTGGLMALAGAALVVDVYPAFERESSAYAGGLLLGIVVGLMLFSIGLYLALKR